MNWIVWALLSALFAAATAILAKVGVEGVDSNVATAVRTSVIVVFTWVFAYLFSPSTAFVVPTNRALTFLVLSGLATGFSWLCYFRALQLGPASRVAPIDKLSVVLVIIIAVLALHEPLGWKQWVGGALMVLGAITLASN